MGATVLDAQQGGSISGQTRSAETGRPLAAVQVALPDLNLGSLSQGNGRYLIQNVPAGTHSVTVTRIGSRSVTVQVVVGAGQVVALNFDLETEALALDEIIVTGTAGGTQRRAIGNVVGQVDAASLAEIAPISEVRDLIGTRVPGVAIMGGSGAVGSGSTIRIRGASSLSLANNPIVYVDGVRIESGIRPDGGFSSGAGSRLDDFSPEDIESIEIIKGPAAATLYGTEAANGVIQIITKRGQEGDVVFDMAIRGGTNWFPNPRRYFGEKWYQVPGGALENAFLYDEDELREGRPYVGLGSNQYYHIGARGGSAVLQFAASLDKDSEGGVFADHPNSNNRESGRLNVDFLAGETLDVSMSLNYSQRSHVNPEPGAGVGPMGNMFFGTHPLHAPARRGFYVQKPEDIANIFLVTDAGRFTGSVTMNHTPTSWMAHRLTFGIDQTDENHTELYPRHPLGAAGPLGGRSLGELREKSFDYTNYTVDYSNTVTAPVTSNIESSTSVGFQYYDRQTVTTSQTGRVFPAPPLITMGATTGTPSASGDFEENVTVGVYLQEQLAFGDNLFVTGAIRADDNSAFGAEYDLAIYPKVSAAYNMEEPFEFASWVDLVRLRGAWGAAGQQPGTFAGVRLYDPIPGPGGSAAISPGEVGNPALKPERSEELEVGFDASVFGGRSDIEFTYYNRKTKDAIVRRSLAPSAGFPGQQWVNAGQVSNWGIEVGINTQVIRRGGPLSWNVGVAFATMKNKLDRLGLPGTTELTAGGRGARHVEGFPLASAFEWEITQAEFDGSGDVDNSTVMCLGPASLGAVRREQASEVPFSEGCAQIYQGGPTDPTWDLSISSDMTFFENWRLSATVQGRGGGDAFSRNLGPTVQCCPWARVVWTLDDAVMPAIGDLRRQGVGHYDAGFIRLRDLTLTYEVPEGLAARIGASRASFGLQMQNVWQIWRASWYSKIVERRGLEGDNKEAFYIPEPDIRSTGNFNTSNYIQQPSKTLLASVRLTF